MSNRVFIERAENGYIVECNLQGPRPTKFVYKSIEKVLEVIRDHYEKPLMENTDESQ